MKLVPVDWNSGTAQEKDRKHRRRLELLADWKDVAEGTQGCSDPLWDSSTDSARRDGELDFMEFITHGRLHKTRCRGMAWLLSLSVGSPLWSGSEKPFVMVLPSDLQVEVARYLDPATRVPFFRELESEPRRAQAESLFPALYFARAKVAHVLASDPRTMAEILSDYECVETRQGGVARQAVRLVADEETGQLEAVGGNRILREIVIEAGRVVTAMDLQWLVGQFPRIEKLVFNWTPSDWTGEWQGGGRGMAFRSGTRRTALDQESIHALSGLRRLKSLGLRAYDAGTAELPQNHDLSSLGSLQNLEELDLSDNSIMDDQLGFLGKLKNLSKLKLSCARHLRGTFLRGIANPRGLLHLDLFNVDLQDSDFFRALVQCSELKALNLMHCSLRAQEVEAISHLTKLEDLALQNSCWEVASGSGPDWMPALLKMKTLKHLLLGGAHWVGAREAQALGEAMPDLESLNLKDSYNGHVISSEEDYFKTFKKLRILNVGSSTRWGICRGKDARFGLPDTLEYLHLSKIHLNVHDIEAICANRKLKYLILRNSQLEPKAIQRLGSLESLQALTLALAGGRLGPEEIRALANLHELRYLDLFGWRPRPHPQADPRGPGNAELQASLGALLELKHLGHLSLSGLDLDEETQQHFFRDYEASHPGRELVNLHKSGPMALGGLQPTSLALNPGNGGSAFECWWW